MLYAIGGGLILFGLALVIKGFESDKRYGVLLCVLGAFLVGKGTTMLELF